jgi:hypothetical protein
VVRIDYVKHTPEASPVPVLLCRERRAHARAKALQTIHDLVRSLSLLSAKQDILRIAARAWRYDPPRLASMVAGSPPSLHSHSLSLADRLKASWLRRVVAAAVGAAATI